MSTHGPELFAASAESGAPLFFEAAVAGVIPAIRVIEESLAGAHVERVHGIVNGTTNYILTEMARNGLSYDDALKQAQDLGYAEADPTADVGGGDAAAKMAILARLAFGLDVSFDQVTFEGIENITSDGHRIRQASSTWCSSSSAPPSASTAGSACGSSRRSSIPSHPLASVHGSFNAVTVESPAITEITMSGPGAGGVQTASAVLGDLVSILSGVPRTRGDAAPATIVDDVESAFYLHLEVEDRPGVLAEVAAALGNHDVSVRNFNQQGTPDAARLVMVMHPTLESKFFAAVDEIAALPFVGAAPRAIRVIEEEFRRLMAGLIERYIDRMPAEVTEQIVSIEEGSTPLVHAPALSERVDADVFLKLEGANPTGSFKDRGMTCAVSAAAREGAEAVICASTGNTAASAAAYAARAGMTCAVLVPEGKIAAGKLAQALIYGARVISLNGNFDVALQLVRDLADNHPISLVNSVNDFRLEGQKTSSFEIVDEIGPIDLLTIPVGNAGNITAYWKGFKEYDEAPELQRLPGSRRRAARRGPPGREPRDRRHRDPHRQPGALGRGDGRDHRVARRSPRRDRRRDPRRVPLAPGQRRRLLRAGLAASVAGLIKYGVSDAARAGAEGGRPKVVCVLTGNGLKDPDTAFDNVGSVIPCEPEMGQLEKAVLG